MQIQPASPVPVFQQIADGIRSAVAAGAFRPGDLIPSVRAQALTLLVNPNTVQRAYEQLEREGLIVSRRGMGMVVAEDSRLAAQNGVETTIRAALTQAITAARAAGLSRVAVDRLYRKTWDELQTDPQTINTRSIMTEPDPAPSVEFPIQLDAVTRFFRSRCAVNNLTLKIPRATTFGFIGLNGAGKTTAIRMMVGLLSPTSGTISIDGIEVPENRAAMKTHVGYVPDRPHAYPWMRVEQAISFARAFYQSKWNDTRYAELARLFKLDPKQRIDRLSKGQGAKLSLLLAICHDPSVLILDEPTSGMDPLVRDEFLEGVLAATSQREQTVLFSTHTLSDVQRLADSVGVMHEGRLLFHQEVDTLLDRTKRIHAVLADDANGQREAPPGFVYQHVQGREWTVTVGNFSQEQVEFIRAKNRISHLDVQDLSLDDVFKDVVRGQAKEVV